MSTTGMLICSNGWHYMESNEHRKYEKDLRYKLIRLMTINHKIYLILILFTCYKSYTSPIACTIVTNVPCWVVIFSQCWLSCNWLGPILIFPSGVFLFLWKIDQTQSSNLIFDKDCIFFYSKNINYRVHTKFSITYFPIDILCLSPQTYQKDILRRCHWYQMFHSK